MQTEIFISTGSHTMDTSATYNNQPDPQLSEDMLEPQQSEPATRPSRRFPAVAGALLTIVAWVLLFFSGKASFFVALTAMVVCCFGLGGTRRHLAVTSMVAAGVLMLVFAIFEVIILYLLSNV